MDIQIKKGSGLIVTTKKYNIGVIAELSWDTTKSWKIDLDLFCAATSFNPITKIYMLENMSALLYHANLKCYDGALVHSGYEQTGVKEVDDEAITVFLNKLPVIITDVIIGACIDPVKSIPLSTFKNAANAKITIRALVEGAGQLKEILSVNLQTKFTTGILIGMYTRVGDNWHFETINQSVKCHTNTPIQEILEAVPCDCL
ncbi:MAG: TerD family protein [candidate division SR1 bacterium]|nr:TerD family protein [candidate division SR1 bacterium]